jgi:hypothetical protein
MWSLLNRPMQPSKARASRRGVRPSAEVLDQRTVLSHMVPIGPQVLAYAQAHIGQIVGDGQCATLAVAAVSSGAGVPYYQLGPTGLNADYVWGARVATLTPSNGNTSAIKPGDILQFRNVTEVDTMTVHYKNGRTTTSINTQSPSHHTAIVEIVGGNAANDIQVYQANVQLYKGESLSAQHQVQWGDYWGGASTVTTNYPQYGFSITVTHTMTSGVIQVYQPYKVVA